MADSPDLFVLKGLFFLFALLAFVVPKLAVVLFVWRRQERFVLARTAAASLADFAVFGALSFALKPAASIRPVEDTGGHWLPWLWFLMTSIVIMTLLNHATLTGALGNERATGWRRAGTLSALASGVAIILGLAVTFVLN